jgi:hypothetical protein
VRFENQVPGKDRDTGNMMKIGPLNSWKDSENNDFTAIFLYLTILFSLSLLEVFLIKENYH